MKIPIALTSLCAASALTFTACDSPAETTVFASDVPVAGSTTAVSASRTPEGDDASLVSRSKPGAVLHDPKAIAERVVRMVQDRAIVSVSGKTIKVDVETVCIHGDTPGAVDIARTIRLALSAQGIEVAPFSARF